MFDSNLYITGGMNEERYLTNKVWIYYGKTAEFEEIKPGLDAAICSHTAIVMGSNILVIGGATFFMRRK